MYNIYSIAFWYKFIFAALILTSEWLFVYHFKKREKYVLRLISSLVVLYVIILFLPIIDNPFYMSFFYLTIFFCTLALIKFCYYEKLQNIFFCGIAAYSLQNMGYVATACLREGTFTILGIKNTINVYSSQSVSVPPEPVVIAIVAAFFVISYFGVYWFGYHVYAEKLREKEDLKINNFAMVALAGVLILIDIVFGLLVQYNDKIDTLSLWMTRIYNLCICLLALWLQFTQLDNKEANMRLVVTERILSEQKHQYELLKQNMDIINIKCHDLKNQIHDVNGEATIEKSELDEIDGAVKIYQSIAKTGNEALDVVLTEKSLMCDKNKINLTYIIDGEKLGFMKPSDIYSLFGNAIDNAIEAVMPLEEENRNISIIVKKQSGFISVHIENCCAVIPEFKNGLPVTTKEDTENHGFGMMSISSIVDKYRGTMSVEANGKKFSLDILFNAA